MAKIVTMGEIMLRLSTRNFERFIQAGEFEVHYGGSESNVAVSLANLGHETEFVTAVPANQIGDAAIASLRKYNVGTHFISRSGDRLGIYYLEHGSSMRPSQIIYDRADSSIATADIDEFDFDAIFEGASWFHFSGITPALSDKAEKLTEAALKSAKAHGLSVSCDLNYRKKLWSEAKANEVMTRLMQYVDVLCCNEEEADKVFGMKAEATDVIKGELNLAGYEHVYNQLCDKFGFRYIASTMRESFSASNNGWSGVMMDGQTRKFIQSRTYHILPIVDRIGGGDSFTAGCIAGFLEGMSMEDTLEFGTAAAALKHTIPGDVNHVTREEILALRGDSSGRVQR